MEVWHHVGYVDAGADPGLQKGELVQCDVGPLCMGGGRDQKGRDVAPSTCTVKIYRKALKTLFLSWVPCLEWHSNVDELSEMVLEC